jgi:hypothetical protein
MESFEADKMIEIQRFRASDHPKTVYNFASGALAPSKEKMAAAF